MTGSTAESLSGMTSSTEALLFYWRTSLADGTLGKGKFTQKDRKRFIDVPREALMTGILPDKVVGRVFQE